jgi:uncharacterized protein DUF4160
VASRTTSTWVRPSPRNTVSRTPRIRDALLPKLSEFFGISIYIHWKDHGPPHFHARYSGQRASISIDDLTVINGKLAPRALGLVIEWGSLHRVELRDAWRKASNRQTPDPIEPLR